METKFTQYKNVSELMADFLGNVEKELREEYPSIKVFVNPHLPSGLHFPKDKPISLVKESVKVSVTVSVKNKETGEFTLNREPVVELSDQNIQDTGANAAVIKSKIVSEIEMIQDMTNGVIEDVVEIFDVIFRIEVDMRSAEFEDIYEKKTKKPKVKEVKETPIPNEVREAYKKLFIDNQDAVIKFLMELPNSGELIKAIASLKKK